MSVYGRDLRVGQGFTDRWIGKKYVRTGHSFVFSSRCDFMGKPPSIIYSQCDSEEVASLPVLTSSRLGEIPLNEIDQVFSASVAAVREMEVLGLALAIPLLQYALCVYALDVELLAKLRPDVILTCLQTSHSAVSESTVLEDALKAVLGYVPRVVHWKGDDLDSTWNDMQRTADALNVSDKGTQMIDAQKRRMAEIAEAAQGRPRQNVVCLQWPHPLMAASAWVPKMLEMMGALDVCGKREEAVILSEEKLRESFPNIIIVAFCGLNLAQSMKSARRLFERFDGVARRLESSGTRELPAGRVAVVDGEHILSRPGPWLQDSLEVISEILHPEAQKYGHEGRMWNWLS